MAGLSKYFTDTPYEVVDGNIVYASNLNNPFTALATGLSVMSVDIQTSGSKYAIDTGAVNAYIVSLNPAPTAYTEGLEVWLKTSASNTGASIINVNSLGVVDIRRHGLDPLLAGDIPANYFTLLKYSNGFFQIVSASGRGEAEASAETAEAQAIIATEQAVIATTQAGLAEDAKDETISTLATTRADITALDGSISAVEDSIDVIEGSMPSVDVLWSGTATDGTVVDWSATGHNWTDFDLILISCYCTSPTTAEGEHSVTIEASSIPSLVCFQGPSADGANATVRYQLTSITETSLTLELTTYQTWSGYLSKIHGIKLT